MNTHKLELEYDTWHRGMFAGSNLDNPLRFSWYQSAFTHIKSHASGNLLEIGCGRGEFAVWLSKNLPAVNITAVDFSRAAIEIAKQHAANAGAKISLAEDDAQNLRFPDNKFEYVVSCECIEHVPGPQQMAKEIFRVLKPGGKFCITTENYFNGMLLAWAQSMIARRPFNSGSGVQPHENFFFFWHVLAYLRSAGLIVERTESCHYQWLLLPRVDPRKLCTEQFSSNWARLLAKPFGRHFSFLAESRFGQRMNPRRKANSFGKYRRSAGAVRTEAFWLEYISVRQIGCTCRRPRTISIGHAKLKIARLPSFDDSVIAISIYEMAVGLNLAETIARHAMRLEGHLR